MSNNVKPESATTFNEAKNASVSISFPSGPVNLPALLSEKPVIAIIAVLLVPSVADGKASKSAAGAKTPFWSNVWKAPTPLMIVNAPFELSNNPSL